MLRGRPCGRPFFCLRKELWFDGATSGFQFFFFFFPPPACMPMPGALRPHMGGPFKGTYRPTSLNHTARVPCAPGSGPKPRGPATRGRWQAAQSAPPTPFPHARRGAGEAAGSLNRLSRRHDPQSPHRRSLGGGGGVGSTCPPFLGGISHRA